MNFKEHFEKFEAEIRQKLCDDEIMLETLREINTKHEILLKRFDEVIAGLNNIRKLTDDPFFSNDEFLSMMCISVRTAQLWRDRGIIGFSQVSGKIYYKMSDIQKLLRDNYHQSVKNVTKL